MKDILITGACGGMGKSVTELFANRGYRVFALDKKTFPKSENIIPVQADITDEKSIAGAFDAVRAETPELCAIIHLAGIYMLDSLVEMPSSAFELVFRINLGGAYLINKTFLPLFKKGSNIVIVTSELAVRDPLPFTGIYGITKTALDKYAYSLRMELQLSGIAVSVLRAGAVDTEMLSDSSRQLDKFCSGTKLYDVSASRFKNIVNKVEARKISSEKIAKKIYYISERKNPRFAYSVNRNPFLIMHDLLPKRVRFLIIRKILNDPDHRV